MMSLELILQRTHQCITGSAITVGPDPFGIAYDPDHFRYVDVSNGEGGATTVSVINTNTNTLVTTIDLGPGNTPFNFAYDPDNQEMVCDHSW